MARRDARAAASGDRKRLASGLHIYPSPFIHESRILKETRSLAESGLFGRVDIGAVWEDGLAEHETLDRHREVWRVRLWTRRLRGTPGKLLRFAEWYLRLLLRARTNPPDFINCHSLSALPLGALFSLFFGSRIIYDTHELETETQSSVGLRRSLSKIVENALIRRADAVIVVGELIGQWYRTTYALDEVHVVRNIPYGRSRDATPRAVRPLRQMLDIGADELLFICQGMMDDGRGISIILDAFAGMPRSRHVLFLGYGPLADEIRRRAEGHENIHYHPAVPPGELLEYTAAADAGFSLIENTSLSYYYCLPNKMFECIASGIPVIVSDFPEMAKVVDELGCGWKTPVEAESVAALVLSLSAADIASRAKAASSSVLAWSGEEAVMIALYERLLGVREGEVMAREEGSPGYR